MILDNRAIEVSYVVLVLISGLWAFSQVRYSLAYGTLWRWLTAYWLVSKVVFFTLAAWTWWFNDLPETAFTFGLYNLTFAHVIAYLKWRTLPKSNALAPDPPKGPMV